MVNPFDRSFFKFFIGFIGILCFSFGVLIVVGYYEKSDEVNTASTPSMPADVIRSL